MQRIQTEIKTWAPAPCIHSCRFIAELTSGWLTVINSLNGRRESFGVVMEVSTASTSCQTKVFWFTVSCCECVGVHVNNPPFSSSSSHRALKGVFGDNRTLMLTRSSFPGIGKYSGHWLGDNGANWNDIKWAIPGMLEFGLFGVPYVSIEGSHTDKDCNNITNNQYFFLFEVAMEQKVDKNKHHIFRTQ